MFQENDPFMRLRKAAAEAGRSLKEAGEAIMKAFETLLSAEVTDALAKIVVSIKYPADEELRPLATGREWHLMKNAKKHRVRKKYKDLIIKRYFNDIQTERNRKA